MLAVLEFERDVGQPRGLLDDLLGVFLFNECAWNLHSRQGPFADVEGRGTPTLRHDLPTNAGRVQHDLEKQGIDLRRNDDEPVSRQNAVLLGSDSHGASPSRRPLSDQ